MLDILPDAAQVCMDEPQHNRNSRAKASLYAWTFATNALSLVFGMASGILSSRMLGAQGRGELAVISYFPSLMATFWPLAIPQALTLFISRGEPPPDEVVAAGIKLSFGLALIGAASFSILVPFFLAPDNQYLAANASFMCLASAPMVIASFLYAISRGRGDFFWVNCAVVIGAAGYPALLVALWAAGWVSPLILACAGQATLWLIVVHGIYRFGSRRLFRAVPFSVYKACLKQGLTYLLPVLAGTAYLMSDRAILIRTAAMSDIGLYSVALAITHPLILAGEAFVQIGFVEIAAVPDQKASAMLMMRRFQMLQIVVTGSALLLMASIPPLVRWGFGRAFEDAIVLAYIMVPAMAIRTLSRSLDNGLRARGWSRPGTTAGLAALVTLVVLAAALVPALGITTFGLALLGAELVGMVILVRFTRKLLDVTWGSFWGFHRKLALELWTNFAAMSARTG